MKQKQLKQLKLGGAFVIQPHLFCKKDDHFINSLNLCSIYIKSTSVLFPAPLVDLIVVSE